ncbi:MAG: HAD family hydrolase [Gemmatimonadales bacterium]|nr:MAG: HAD family hydrolase [Gemmatimonadales bacterium]
MSGGDVRPVLFDLDGTLIATRRLYLEAFADALEPVLDRRATHDEMMALRPRAEARFLREVGGDEAHPDVMDRFWVAYEARHAADFEGIYPGVPELLAVLRGRGLPLGLVTGKSRRTWEITRPHVEGALGRFDALVFDDDVPEPKPDPSGILLALEALAAGPEGCVYVGDTYSDLEAARSAGLVPVGALWSKRPHEREAFATHARSLDGFVVESPSDLADALAM